MIYAAARAHQPIGRRERSDVSGSGPADARGNPAVADRGMRASPRWPSWSASGTRRSALSLFINLSLATHRWIVASGDPDFWLDADKFRAAGAALALLAFGLGIFSIRAAGQTFISRYEPRVTGCC